MDKLASASDVLPCCNASRRMEKKQGVRAEQPGKNRKGNSSNLEI
jgi:hypothetical protein